MSQSKMDDSKEYTITIGADDQVDGIKSTYSMGIGLSTFTDVSDTITFNPSYEYEWDNGSWPSEHKIENMIKEYPALKLQYLKFLEIYNLCKDDYNSRTNDDEIPF